MPDVAELPEKLQAREQVYAEVRNWSRRTMGSIAFGTLRTMMSWPRVSSGLRALLLLLILFAPSVRSQVASDPNAASVPEDSSIGIDRFHKVNNHLYRGALPSLQNLQALSKLGIATILDLRPAHEKTSDEEQVVKELGMRYVSLPMHGFAAPSAEQVERGLKILQEPRNWPVFVHCHYGVDRTGTLIACYRIQVESWPNQKAKDEAEQIGMHKFERGMKHFILNFAPSREEVAH